MKIGVGLFPTEPVGKMCELAQLAENLGYHNAWFGDSQNIWREAYITMGAVASRTNRIMIGTGVTNPVTRHLAVLASAWATLQEYVPARAILGIGAADSAVRTLGEKPVKIDTLERAIATLRTLMSGDAYSDERSGQTYHLAHSVPARVPIYVAASGPKLLEMAGRVADGAIMLVGTDPTFIEAGLRAVNAGLRSAGRRREDFEVVLWTPTSILDDSAAARELVKAHIARVVIRPLPADLDPAVMEEVKRIRASYDYYQHMQTSADHGTEVPDSLVPHFALAGNPEECLAQLKQIADCDVDQVAVVPYAPVGGDRSTVIEAFADIANEAKPVRG
jgi:5,10-methylenetetrahydromethanopterin reductase